MQLLIFSERKQQKWGLNQVSWAFFENILSIDILTIQAKQK